MVLARSAVQETAEPDKMNSILWSAHHFYGSDRPCAARVAGSDRQYRYAQTFLRYEETRSRSGATGDLTWRVTEPGLYRVRLPRRQHDDGGWRLVWIAKGGELKWCHIDDARAQAIVARLDAGEEYEAARRATRPEAAR